MYEMNECMKKPETPGIMRGFGYSIFIHASYIHTFGLWQYNPIAGKGLAIH